MGKWGFFKGNKENWFSHPIYNWMDHTEFEPSQALHERCRMPVLREAIKDHPGMIVMNISFYPDGTYKEEGKPLLDNIPAFYLVHIKETILDRHTGDIHVFLPVRWNHRFMGIGGAGTNLETDWDKEQTSSLTTWPMAVRNGFACAISTGATRPFLDASWGFYGNDLEWDLIRHWAFYGTHTMTAAAKKIIRAAYGEPIYKSYMHGTSGGGRQVLLEAQNYPEDYDGLWADGPLYDYYNLMFSCLWAPLVYYNEEHKVSLEKYKAAKDLALGMECRSRISFDSRSPVWEDFLEKLLGYETADGKITEEDIRIMVRVWEGPVLPDGNRITYGFGPRITQWPVGPRQFGYLRVKDNGQPAVIPFALQWLRWLVRDPDWMLSECSYEEFGRIYLDHKEEFSDFAFYDPDIESYLKRGGKLMITHGTGDHISPTRLTYDYYTRVWSSLGSEDEIRKGFRVFFPEQGGHALYDWDGPIVANSTGMKALMDWTEKDAAPDELETIQYDWEADRTVAKSSVPAFHLWDWDHTSVDGMSEKEIAILCGMICEHILNE